MQDLGTKNGRTSMNTGRPERGVVPSKDSK